MHTLIKARIATGRTHQIRVHCASQGHPIAGDEKYGDKAYNQWMRRQGLARMFLHARRLEIPLPERSLAIEAPLEARLENLLSHLKK
jgi:23S rRNA pseudouridine955/2504/2580 synthase